MNHTKIVPADLIGSPCQELSVCGLLFGLAFSFFSGIDFFCASTGGPSNPAVAIFY